jgi:hypothetical protein
MRVNVYAEELTTDVQMAHAIADNGNRFYGVRFFLQSPESLHSTELDDDRPAVTFWVPWTFANGHDIRTLQTLFEKADEVLEFIANEIVATEKARDEDAETP